MHQTEDPYKYYGEWLALAEGNRWTRLRRRPFTYVLFQMYDKVVYPVLRQGMVVRCRTFFGAPMAVSLPAGASIFLTGGLTHESEKKLIRYLLHRLTTSDVFVDVGAHYGFYSLLACHRIANGTGIRVLAVEPAEEAFAILKKNLQPYPQARAVQVVSGGCDGSCSFVEFDTRYSEYNSAQSGRYQGKPWLKKARMAQRQVSCMTLTTLCKQYGVLPTLIKVDVEGLESEVIAGGLLLLQSRRPEVILEFHVATDLQPQYLQAEALLRNMGYAPYAVSREGNLEAIQDISAWLKASGLDSDNIVFRAT